METPAASPADALFDSLDAPDAADAAVDAAAAPGASQSPDAPAASDASTPAKEPAAAEVASSAPAAIVTPPPAAEAPPPAQEKLVPLSALEQERRTFNRRIQALEEQIAAGKPKAEAAAAALEPPAPDYLEDPKGYADHQAKRLEAALAELKKTGTTQLESQQRELAELRLQQGLQSAEAAAAAEAPDVMEALSHVRQVRVQQLQTLHPTATQEQIVETIQAEERQMAAAEIAQGRNPYLTMHKIAKTFGYQGKPAAAAAAKPTEPAPPAKPITDALRAAGTLPPDMTLGKTGGAAPGDPSGAEDDGAVDEILSEAFSERFGRRRA